LVALAREGGVEENLDGGGAGMRCCRQLGDAGSNRARTAASGGTCIRRNSLKALNHRNYFVHLNMQPPRLDSFV
jgi:hypothetical protein